jgi:alkylmercury lyase
VGVAVLVLTNFGERPVPSSRLAEVLGRPVSDVEARAQGHCSTGAPVGDGIVRAEDGLITLINPERTKSAPRRWLQIGDRRFGMAGCAYDVFLYAPLVRPSLQVEETCPATGAPMRLVFTPSGVDSVEPTGAVVPILPPREFDRLEEFESLKDIDASFCAQCPFYSSAEAAQGWLAAHPGGRVVPVREAWDLSFHRIWRDRMSALLNLG